MKVNKQAHETLLSATVHTLFKQEPLPHYLKHNAVYIKVFVYNLQHVNYQLLETEVDSAQGHEQLPKTISGARYCLVPTTDECSSSSNVAEPKSMTSTSVCRTLR